VRKENGYVDGDSFHPADARAYYHKLGIAERPDSKRDVNFRGSLSPILLPGEPLAKFTMGWSPQMGIFLGLPIM
jgi:hypothetical protein